MARGRMLRSVGPGGGRIEDHSRSVQGFVFVMFALIVAGLLVLVVVTTGGYGSVLGQQTAGAQKRASLSVVASAVKAADTAGAVSHGEGPQGEVLILRDPADGTTSRTYETRIYLYDGHLVEEYVASDAALAPDDAVRLADTTTFTFSMDDRGLLTFSTDAGTRTIALRSAQRPSSPASSVDTVGGGA